METANNLFVIYRLQGGAITERDMAAAVSRLGVAVPLLPGAWFLSTRLGGGEAAEELRRSMNADDLLLVVDASNNEFARFGIGCEACESVDELWDVQKQQ